VDANPEGLPPEPAEPAKEFLPLDAVRDEIRETIARDRVEQKLLELMPLIQSDLLKVFREYEDRRLDAENAGKNPADVPPPEFNLEEIAQKHGLVAKQTAPLSFLELRDTLLGKSIVRDRSVPYSQFAFVQPLFEPAWSVGVPENLVDQMQGGFTQYVAVKVDDTPTRTPPLAEIRDEVVRVYKRVKAREHALAEAQALAKKAEASGESLQQQFAESEGQKPIQSDPFSWYVSQFGSQFHLSKPYGVDHAGPDFFETVFSLEPGAAAAVWNHDQSIAYVVQLVRHQQSEDSLRNRFLIEGNRADRFPQKMLLSGLREFEMRYALEESILAEAGVEWLPVSNPPSGGV
jgi:hypothetical protein